MLSKKHGKSKSAKGLIVAAVAVGMLALSAGVVSAHGGGGWFGQLGTDEDTLVAEELGITVEELQAAQDAARTRALEQALADGVITQEEYDTYQAREALEPYLDHDTLKAAALGISVDEVNDKTTAEWLTELGLDRETYETKLQEARTAAIQQAVTDGVITQEQADALADCPMGRGLSGHRGGPNGMQGGMQDDETSGSGTVEDSGFRMRFSLTSPDEA